MTHQEQQDYLREERIWLEKMKKSDHIFFGFMWVFIIAVVSAAAWMIWRG